jgi:hypothetical protein
VLLVGSGIKTALQWEKYTMSNNSNAKTKEPTDAKQQPVKTIRRGAIAASIWKRQTATGFEYLDFSLSRSWKLKSGEKEGYSQNFFVANEEALSEVVSEACRFIRTQLSVAGMDGPAMAEQVDLA